jgi:hypothetical protein
MLDSKKHEPLFKLVPDKSDWRMKFDAHDAPPAPVPYDPELEARLADAYINHDAAVAMEDANSHTVDGVPIHPTYSPDHRRPFVAADTGTQHN